MDIEREAKGAAIKIHHPYQSFQTTVDDILALCARVRDEALEEAAKIAEARFDGQYEGYSYVHAGHGIARDIRALKAPGRKERV